MKIAPSLLSAEFRRYPRADQNRRARRCRLPPFGYHGWPLRAEHHVGPQDRARPPSALAAHVRRPSDDRRTRTLRRRFREGRREHRHGALGSDRARQPSRPPDQRARRPRGSGDQSGDIAVGARRDIAVHRPLARHVGEPGLQRSVVHPDVDRQDRRGAPADRRAPPQDRSGSRRRRDARQCRATSAGQAPTRSSWAPGSTARRIRLRRSRRSARNVPDLARNRT